MALGKGPRGMRKANGGRRKAEGGRQELGGDCWGDGGASGIADGENGIEEWVRVRLLWALILRGDRLNLKVSLC